MRKNAAKYAGRAILIAFVVFGSAMVARVIWEGAALNAVRATGETRAGLVAQTIRNTIAQNEHFPLVMALDPDVQAALSSPQDPDLATFLNRKLETISDSSSPAALYVMKPDGTTLAASNWYSEDSFVGQYYGFRSYFTEAMSTGKGSYFGIGATTGRAGYFVSRAVGSNPVLGVANARVVVRLLDFPRMQEEDLRGAIGFEAQDHIPIPLAEAVMDYQLLEEVTNAEGQAIQRVLVVAAAPAAGPPRRAAPPPTA
jgi:C4-dicarboxylate-specific signal transduction histidine kinase